MSSISCLQMWRINMRDVANHVLQGHIADGGCEEKKKKRMRTGISMVGPTVKTFIDSVAIHGWPACE